MADNYKWSGATSGEWNVVGNWLKWNGSAWVASDTIPCRDSGPSDDNILFAGSVTNGMTSRDATYSPHDYGQIEVAADYDQTAWLPDSTGGDTPLLDGGPIIVRRDGLTIPPQAGNITDVEFHSESGWQLSADGTQVYGTVTVYGDGFAHFGPGYYAYCLKGSAASCNVDNHAQGGCSAETDPPDASDVRAGVSFENDLKTGTLVVEGTRLAKVGA
jgi:hypothetical protein